jgi:hypothetical protein
LARKTERNEEGRREKKDERGAEIMNGGGKQIHMGRQMLG